MYSWTSLACSPVCPPCPPSPPFTSTHYTRRTSTPTSTTAPYKIHDREVARTHAPPPFLFAYCGSSPGSSLIGRPLQSSSPSPADNQPALIPPASPPACHDGRPSALFYSSPLERPVVNTKDTLTPVMSNVIEKTPSPSTPPSGRAGGVLEKTTSVKSPDAMCARARDTQLTAPARREGPRRHGPAARC